MPFSLKVNLSEEFLKMIDRITCISREPVSSSLEDQIKPHKKRVKDQQRVDFNQRVAILTENLFSSNYPSAKGIMKHAEMKIGLAVRKPLNREIQDFINHNYTKEQIEQLDNLEELSRHQVKQVWYLVQGEVGEVDQYNPFDIVSKDESKVMKAVSQIFVSNDNNSRFFIEGMQTEISKDDCEILTQILLKSEILQMVAKYQSSDNTDI